MQRSLFIFLLLVSFLGFSPGAGASAFTDCQEIFAWLGTADGYVREIPLRPGKYDELEAIEDHLAAHFTRDDIDTFELWYQNLFLQGREQALLDHLASPPLCQGCCRLSLKI